MEWLNYHHLLYFYTVAREGGLEPASKVLRLAHSTISGQIRQLEDALGEELFDRSGRRLVLTEIGRLVYGYAEEIFGLGRELQEAVAGRATGRPVRLVVGITDVLPKLVVRRLLEPAFRLPEPVHVVCEEDRHERLLAELALHNLDVVLADAPVPPGSNVRAFNHLLGECGVTWFGTPALAARYADGFPASLDDAPVLMPTDTHVVRRSLERWLDGLGVRPRIVAEFEDSALLKTFGQDGLGLFPAPSAVADAVRRQYEVVALGEATGVRERFYAISAERRLKNPAVVAISEAARADFLT